MRAGLAACWPCARYYAPAVFKPANLGTTRKRPELAENCMDLRIFFAEFTPTPKVRHSRCGWGVFPKTLVRVLEVPKRLSRSVSRCHTCVTLVLRSLRARAAREPVFFAVEPICPRQPTKNAFDLLVLVKGSSV